MGACRRAVFNELGKFNRALFLNITTWKVFELDKMPIFDKLIQTIQMLPANILEESCINVNYILWRMRHKLDLYFQVYLWRKSFSEIKDYFIFFLWHVNPYAVILCLEVRELSILYIQIYIFV